MSRTYRGAGLVLLLASMQTSFANVPRGSGYGEDLQTKNLAAHSTFHYEFTRALARAAGFSAEEAERLAVINEATDTGVFQGETGFGVDLQGTERISPNGGYWHFARRDRDNVTGEYMHPGGRNTCAYFIAAPDMCHGEAELDEIENWAVYNRATPSTGAPQISFDRGASYQTVAGRSLEALAIYLHALADSYSHEACMKAEQFRGHKPQPLECTAVAWHLEEEFGREQSADEGVQYTEEAGLATWQALKWFREQNGLIEPARLSEAQVEAFIKAWVKLEQAPARRALAVKVFETM